MNHDSTATAEPRGALRLLQATLVAQCFGAAWLAWQSPTSLNSALFVGFSVHEEIANRIDHIGVTLLMVLPLVALARNVAVAWVGLVPIAMWFLVDAGATTFNGGEPLYQIELMSQATRYLTPIAIVLLLAHSHRAGATLLRVAIALVFAAHGWKALALVPSFQDLIWGTILRVQDLGLGSRVALQPDVIDSMLRVIGTIDLIAAALILSTRWRIVPLYMAFWGVVTALSRVLLWGSGGVGEALLRALHVGVPLFLWILWRRPTPRVSQDA